jgi:protoporphyrinogen oxidase
VAVLPHNASPERVPPGKGLVTAYLRSRWCRSHWDLDDGAIVDHVLQAVKQVGVPARLERRVTGTYISRVVPATLIRRPGDYRALAATVGKALMGPTRVLFAGSDYLADSSTNRAVHSGEAAAEHARKYLGLPPACLPSDTAVIPGYGQAES